MGNAPEFPARDEPSDSSWSQLALAVRNTEKLLSTMELQAADLDKDRPVLTVEQLSAGRAIMEEALASARRLLQSLRAAQALAESGGQSEDESEIP